MHRIETYKPRPRPAGETRARIRDAVVNLGLGHDHERPDKCASCKHSRGEHAERSGLCGADECQCEGFAHG